MFNNIVQPYGNPAAFVSATPDPALEAGRHGYGAGSNGLLDDISQLWLWTDDGNEDWFPSFS